MNQRWIGVDLDGTLAKWQDWGSGDDYSIGPPIPEMLERVKRWIKAGIKVKIFTARCSEENWFKPVRPWLDEHGLGHLEVTNVKDIYMKELWDDCAIRVSYNTGQPCCDHYRRGKKLWIDLNGKI